MVVTTSLWVEMHIYIGFAKTSTVVPAKAGTHSELDRADVLWIPAYAGMTER
jgi:hypothetical protein